MSNYISEWNRQQDRAFFGFARRAARQVNATVAATRAVRALTVGTVARKTGLPLGMVQAAMDAHPELIPQPRGRYDWQPLQPQAQADDQPEITSLDDLTCDWV